MKRKRSIPTWLYAILASALLLLPMATAAQKGQLKGNTQPQPTLEGGKGAIKAATPHDTLVGGDGFIPRTVIDSFPGQSLDAEETEAPPGTSVRREDLDASKARIQAMQVRIKTVDSALAVYRADTSGAWTPARINEIDSLLSISKSQIVLAEQALGQLDTRWEALKNPPVPKEAVPNPETASQPSKATPAAPAKTPSDPAKPVATVPASPPQPGTPSAPSGKGKIKGK